MFSKFVILFAIAATARAGILSAATPLAVAQPVLAKHAEEYDPHPQYNFGYDIQDSLSGDSKSQVESRDGDVVRGQYSLIDADGYKRIVDYTADPINGFNAVVSRQPLGHAVAPVVKAVAAAPLVHAAPALIKSAPLAYSTAPIIKSAYSSPILSYKY